jgi:hypothetical protein
MISPDRVVDDPTAPKSKKIVFPKKQEPKRTAKTMFVLPFSVTPTTYQAVTEEIGLTFPEEPVADRPIPRMGDQVFYFLAYRRYLPVMPEREDLIFTDAYVSTGTTVDVVPAPTVAKQQIKIYALGYEYDTDGKAGFQWNAAGSYFALRLTKGVYAQTLFNPLVGPAGLKLSWTMANSGNAVIWVQYKIE